MSYIKGIMNCVSLTSLCDGVKYGLRYSGIDAGDSVSFVIPENIRKISVGSPENLFNFLNLLLTWILTETRFGSVVVEWSSAGDGGLRDLLAAVRPDGSPGPAPDGDLRLFQSLPSVSALLEDLGGKVTGSEAAHLEFRVSLPRAENSADRPIEIEEVIRDLGEPDFCIDMIGEYMDKTGGLIDRLEEGIAARDSVTVHRIAHTIKGGAFTIRAAKLRGPAGALESEARAGRLENGAFYLARIRDEYKCASSYFLRIRNEYRHGTKKNSLR
jgi:HPt (histidine-containing phosphotransfer) domain-containing protein